jgi:hypothetical protein
MSLMLALTLPTWMGARRLRKQACRHQGWQVSAPLRSACPPHVLPLWAKPEPPGKGNTFIRIPCSASERPQHRLLRRPWCLHAANCEWVARVQSRGVGEGLLHKSPAPSQSMPAAQLRPAVRAIRSPFAGSSTSVSAREIPITRTKCSLARCSLSLVLLRPSSLLPRSPHALRRAKTSITTTLLLRRRRKRFVAPRPAEWDETLICG